jgi:tRNA G18 (ribose-2'-O)-methylase SpoU
MRDKTRRQRYDEKKQSAKTYPISIATVNFKHDGNLAYIIRSAACFAAECVHVIGSVPDRSVLNPLSGSLSDYVDIKQYSTPVDFLNHAKQNNLQIVSAELAPHAISIEEYKFDFNRPVCIVVGHEEVGIPTEIIRSSDAVYIPMPGVGYCLNTAQAGNILLYEAVKKYEAKLRYMQQWVESRDIHLP